VFASLNINFLGLLVALLAVLEFLNRDEQEADDCAQFAVVEICVKKLIKIH
jgi:hypothetical protein